MGNWLIYIHASNAKKDLKSAQKCLKEMQRNLALDVSAFVIMFGPTVKSPASLSVYRKDAVKEILVLENTGIPSVTGNIATFVNFLLSHKINIDAVCLYTHGAAHGFGSWHGWSEPFLQLNDAVRLLIDPFNVPLVLFDSCFQGAMSCLYELSPSVQYVLASPAFQPFASVLCTKKFGQLGHASFYSRKDLARFAHDMNCEWHTLTKAKWKCMLVLDMTFIPEIAHLVHLHMNDLVFDKFSQIDKEDANLHDLYTAARNVPEISRLVTLCAKETCDTCWSGCTKRVHGVSMEAHLPRKWIKCYISTKWYKRVVANKKGFENDRLYRNIMNSKNDRAILGHIVHPMDEL
jgi:hypothetical protein